MTARRKSRSETALPSNSGLPLSGPLCTVKVVRKRYSLKTGTCAVVLNAPPCIVSVAVKPDNTSSVQEGIVWDIADLDALSYSTFLLTYPIVIAIWNIFIPADCAFTSSFWDSMERWMASAKCSVKSCAKSLSLALTIYSLTAWIFALSTLASMAYISFPLFPSESFAHFRMAARMVSMQSVASVRVIGLGEISEPSGDTCSCSFSGKKYCLMTSMLR